MILLLLFIFLIFNLDLKYVSIGFNCKTFHLYTYSYYLNTNNIICYNEFKAKTCASIINNNHNGFSNDFVPFRFCSCIPIYYQIYLYLRVYLFVNDSLKKIYYDYYINDIFCLTENSIGNSVYKENKKQIVLNKCGKHSVQYYKNTIDDEYWLIIVDFLCGRKKIDFTSNPIPCENVNWLNKNSVDVIVIDINLENKLLNYNCRRKEKNTQIHDNFDKTIFTNIKDDVNNKSKDENKEKDNTINIDLISKQDLFINEIKKIETNYINDDNKNKEIIFNDEKDFKKYLIEETKYNFGKHYKEYKQELSIIIDNYIESNEYLYDKNIEEK